MPLTQAKPSATATVMPRREPTDAEFRAACAVVTRYVQDPRSGWDIGRGAHVSEQLDAWRLLLSDNERHAACDGEKS